MSTTHGPAYCEIADVQNALQEADASMGTGPLADADVEAAIYGASDWLSRAINAHWYDSNAAAADLIDSTARTASDILLDVPSSPHPQRGQLMRTSDRVTGGTKYPNTNAGKYVRLTLPYRYVESVDTLDVRQRGGEYEDWVAASDKLSGPGEDYYVQPRGQNSYGRTYLFVNAASIGARTHWENLLRLEVSYGQDWADTPWESVKRGVAALAGATLVDDADLETMIPSEGQLVSVTTQADRLLDQAIGSDPGHLSDYLAAPVA